MSNRAFLTSQLATARTHTEGLSSWERDSIRQSIHGKNEERSYSERRNDRSETTSRGRNTRG